MKLKNLIIFFLIFIFVFFLPSIVFFVSNLSFNSWNFLFAWKINNFLSDYFDNPELKLKKWDYYYRLGEYKDAIRTYSQIDCTSWWDWNFCYELFHNKWNAYYREWEKTTNINEKILLWTNSLKSYNSSLNIRQDSETQANYEFVKEKLEDLLNSKQKDQQEQSEQDQEQQQEQNDENSKEEENNNNNSQDKDTDSSNNQNDSWEQPWNNEQIIPKSPSMWLWWEEEEWNKELSKEEKEFINRYLEWLENEEVRNRELNKQQKNDIFDNFFDFDNNIWWEEYDW